MIWTAFLIAIYLAIAIPGLRRTMVTDEIVALLAIAKPVDQLFEFLRQDMLHPPLAHVLIRGWLKIGGFSDLHAKLWALIPNAATIILAVPLARRITSEWRLAALLMCVPCFRVGSSVHLLRNYGLCYALTLATVLIWDCWRSKPRTQTLCVLTLLLIALFYTSMLSLMLVPALLLINWLYGKRQTAFALAVGVAIVCFIPWLIQVIPVYLNRNLGPNMSWIHTGPHIALLELPYDFLSGEDPGNNSLSYPFSGSNVRRLLAGPALLLNLSLAFLVWRKGPALAKRAEAYRWVAICAIIASAPCLGLWSISLLGTPILHGRYVVFIVPLYWLIVVQLVALAGNWGKILLCFGFAPWIAASILASLVHHVPASAVRRGTVELMTQLHEDDLILFDMKSNQGWGAYWEWTRRLARSDHFATVGIDVAPHEATVVDLRAPADVLPELKGQVFLFSGVGQSRQKWQQLLIGCGYRLAETVAPPVLTRFAPPAI